MGATMKAYPLILISSLLSFACVPTAPAEEPSPDVQPKPVAEGAIPWAPGEGPGEAREVGEQPRSSDEPIADEQFDRTKGDGLVGAGQMPGCTGKVTLPLRAEVQARTYDLKACNTTAPSDFRGEGLLKYTVRVGSSGQVEKLYQLEDTLKLSSVTACIEAKLKEQFEEPPLSGCAQFVVPYTLVVKEGQEIAPVAQEAAAPK